MSMQITIFDDFYPKNIGFGGKNVSKIMKTQKHEFCFWLVWNNITILYQKFSFLSGFSKLEASMHTALGFWSLWFNSPATLPPEPTR